VSGAGRRLPEVLLLPVPHLCRQRADGEAQRVSGSRPAANNRPFSAQVVCRRDPDFDHCVICLIWPVFPILVCASHETVREKHKLVCILQLLAAAFLLLRLLLRSLIAPAAVRCRVTLTMCLCCVARRVY
jgi:hypothetical protein